jgi:hypothetical protein
MAIDKGYRTEIGRGLESQELETREGVTFEDLHVTPGLAFANLKALPGADEVIKQMPGLQNVADWFALASFRVCRKTGTARYLDIWDADHFDGSTDMKRSVDDCRAWFSGDGYTFWGSGQTKTGRVNCYFEAPDSGDYVCTASLQSYPSNSSATVLCLIDSFSFGALTWSGTIHQPHPCNLSAGFHHFRIQQQAGSFFFLALTVHRV